MDMQATRMGKQLMLDDSKLAQFTTLYKDDCTEGLPSGSGR